MSKIGEISGVEVYLSPQQYEEYKNSLEDEIERLEKRSKEIYEGFMATQEELKEYAEENERLQNIIKEVREYIENGSDFKSIYFKETDTEFWKIIMEDNLKNDLLKILKGE